MKAQKHHPRICIREKKERDKGQECEDPTACRLCAEPLLLQGTLVALGPLVKVVFADQINQLVDEVLKECWGKIIPTKIPGTQNRFGLCSLRSRWECLGTSAGAEAQYWMMKVVDQGALWESLTLLRQHSCPSYQCG